MNPPIYKKKCIFLLKFDFLQVEFHLNNVDRHQKELDHYSNPLEQENYN